MTKFYKGISLNIIIWILILWWNYYKYDNLYLLISCLFLPPLVIHLMKLSNGVRLNKPYKENLIQVCILVFMLIATFLSKGFNSSIFKMELAILKPRREKVIQDIKSGQYKTREYGVKAYEVIPHFPRISWFGENDVLLDNLNEDSFRIRFFLPKSKTDKICLVYSEDKLFNKRVEDLINKLPTEHKKLEQNWYLTDYVPGVSEYKLIDEMK